MSVIRRSDTSVAPLPRMGSQFMPIVTASLRVIFLIAVAMLLILVLLPAAVGAVRAQM